MMNDLISRQWIIKRLEAEKEYRANRGERGAEKGLCYALEIVDDMPSAQEWIPITSRPMTEEERQEWSERIGYRVEYAEAIIYTGQLPDDGQAVMVWSKYGGHKIDTFENDPDYGCGFEDNGDMDGITHWMPLPKKPQEEEK